MKIGLAILNKNEESALPSVIERIDRSIVSEIFAIDGGSTDSSVSILVENGIKVLSQTSFGRGEAVKNAIDYAKGKLDAIIFLSSDGNEDPRDIKKFVEALQNNYSLVIGSRMMTGASNEEDIKFFRPRKMGNKFFSVLAFLYFGIGRCKYITDPINGYRAILLKSWSDVKLKSSGYSIEYEMSIESYKKKFKVYEFPTEEMQRIGGFSQATATKTSFALLRTLIFKIFN